jgi:hypothetical protein
MRSTVLLIEQWVEGAGNKGSEIRVEITLAEKRPEQ